MQIREGIKITLGNYIGGPRAGHKVEKEHLALEHRVPDTNRYPGSRYDRQFETRRDVSGKPELIVVHYKYEYAPEPA